MKPSLLKETSKGYQVIEIETALFNQRELFLTDAITNRTATSLIQQLMILDKDQEPITLYINSPGGEVMSGLAIYDYIMKMQSPVNTVCIGMAASMAAILFLAGQKRSMYEHTKIMIHDPSFASANVSGMKPHEIQEKIESLEKTSQELAQIISQRTNMELSQVLEKTKQDTYFDANQAIKKNIATEIL